MSTLNNTIKSLNQIVNGVADITAQLTNTSYLERISEIMETAGNKTDDTSCDPEKFRRIFYENAVQEAFNVYGREVLKREKRPGAKLILSANIPWAIEVLNNSYSTVGWVLELKDTSLVIHYNNADTTLIDLDGLVLKNIHLNPYLTEVETSEALECFYIVSELIAPGSLKAPLRYFEKIGTIPRGNYIFEKDGALDVISVGVNKKACESWFLGTLRYMLDDSRTKAMKATVAVEDWNESIMRQVNNNPFKKASWTFTLLPDSFTINYSNGSMATICIEESTLSA